MTAWDLEVLTKRFNKLEEEFKLVKEKVLSAPVEPPEELEKEEALGPKPVEVAVNEEVKKTTKKK